MNVDRSGYFTSEQQKYLAQRQQGIGHERTLQILSEWNEALKQFQTAFDQGVNPTDTKLISPARQLSNHQHELLGEEVSINESFEQRKKKIIEDTAAIDPKESELTKCISTSMDAVDSQ
ncbi:hypothetical protein KDK_49340 [Dictyobacter kobayashii]|uniref:Uncharacterized protein n=2 Tax=Dictyobacter kobayashii TaxID=2014872 RepID=A0A402AQ08_9CHLR|nr:hypothetical protein KDK_49340 [Dictyobacter kobayashii]